MARNKRSFWDRNLAAGKVRVALESLGGGLTEFEKAYNETRRVAGPRAFTPEQTAALTAFSGNGRNIENLASELGVKVPTARGFVARAVEAGLI
jgi:DNA-binding MarR family transcriptional regulator